MRSELGTQENIGETAANAALLVQLPSRLEEQHVLEKFGGQHCGV